MCIVYVNKPSLGLMGRCKQAIESLLPEHSLNMNQLSPYSSCQEGPTGAFRSAISLLGGGEHN